jgi:predicted permease
MKTLKVIRIIALTALCIFTGWLVFRTINAAPDPGYGRFPAIMGNGLTAFVVWIPYNIICMFADGNKKLGIIALGIVCFALAILGIIIVADHFGARVFGLHVLALLSLPVFLVAVWVLSAISFSKKRKQNKRLHSIAASGGSE